MREAVPAATHETEPMLGAFFARLHQELHPETDAQEWTFLHQSVLANHVFETELADVPRTGIESTDAGQNETLGVLEDGSVTRELASDPHTVKHVANGCDVPNALIDDDNRNH